MVGYRGGINGALRARMELRFFSTIFLYHTDFWIMRMYYLLKLFLITKYTKICTKHSTHRTPQDTPFILKNSRHLQDFQKVKLPWQSSSIWNYSKQIGTSKKIPTATGRKLNYLLIILFPLKMTFFPQKKFASNSKFYGAFKLVFIEHLIQQHWPMICDY